MTGNVIDFIANGRRPARNEDGFSRSPELSPEDRLHQTEDEAARILDAIRSTLRLSRIDRRLIARNFGGLIEKHFGSNAKRAASEIFIAGCGDEHARSLNKKRRRYFRFADEALPEAGDGEAGTYATSGDTIIRLFKAFQNFTDPKHLDQAVWLDSIFALSRSTSYSRKTTRLTQPSSSQARLIQAHDDLIDRIVQETDAVNFFRETLRHPLIYVPTVQESGTQNGRSFCAQPPKAIARIPDEHRHRDMFGDWTRLPGLPVEIAIGRIFFKRQVLAFDVPIPDCAMPPAASSDENTKLFRALVFEAIRKSGFSPSSLDWGALAVDRVPVPGTHWITCWYPRTLNLRVRCADAAENCVAELDDEKSLDLGPFDEADGYEIPTADGQRTALLEKYGTMNDEKFDELHAIKLPSMPDRWFVYRDFFVELAGAEFVCDFPDDGAMGGYFLGDPDFKWIERESVLSSPDASTYLDQKLRFIDDFKPPQSPTDSMRQMPKSRSSRFSTDQRPVFVPFFDAPSGPTPADQDTLADLIFRSLAYSDGRSGLYPMLKAAIDHSVGLLETYRAEQANTFEAAMRSRGFGTDTHEA